MDKDYVLIQELEEIRAKNNKSWMRLVKLAFKHAPEEAREVMKSIVDYDKQITEITNELVKGESNEKE